MSKKSISDKRNTQDKSKHDYNQYRDKNTTGDATYKSDNKRSTSGTGPRDQNK